MAHSLFKASLFCCLAFLASWGWGAAVNCFQTTAVFYRGLTEQPILGATVSDSWNGDLWTITFELSEDTPLEAVSNFKLYATSSKTFIPSAKGRLIGKLIQNGRTLSIAKETPGVNRYISVTSKETLWLVGDVAPLATPDAPIDAKLTKLAIDGADFPTVNSGDPAGAGEVFPFAYRVLAYWRATHQGSLSADKLRAFTDIVFFQLGLNNEGVVNIPLDFKELVAKTKALRDEQDIKVNLIAGIAHCKDQFVAFSGDPAKRATFIRTLVEVVRELELDGVDIDWEYPENATEWAYYEVLIRELKPALFPAQLSIAISGWNNTPKALAQQLDFMNMMSYDSQSTDGHSPLWLMTNDITSAHDTSGLPYAKIVSGLPAYTNLIGSCARQYGWSNVVNDLGAIIFNSSPFIENWHGHSKHSYNPLPMITQKCNHLLANRRGGAMVWAADTDVSYNHQLNGKDASFVKHLAKVYPKAPLGEHLTVTTAADWAQIAHNEQITLAADITLTAADVRPQTFSGHLDGQGHTITITGGGAAIKTVTGPASITNLNVVVPEGATLRDGQIGALAGDLWAPANTSLLIENSTATIGATIQSTSDAGRVGGFVGHSNIGSEGASITIRHCAVKLLSTAKLISSDGTHPAVGGFLGNDNSGNRYQGNSVTCQAGVTLQAPAGKPLSAFVGQIGWGQTADLSGNYVAYPKTAVGTIPLWGCNSLTYAIGKPHAATRTAPVTFTEGKSGAVFTLDLPIVVTQQGLQLFFK